MGCTINLLPDSTVKNLAGKSTVALLVGLSCRPSFDGAPKRFCNSDFQFIKGCVASKRSAAIKQRNRFHGIVFLGQSRSNNPDFQTFVVGSHTVAACIQLPKYDNQ